MKLSETKKQAHVQDELVTKATTAFLITPLIVLLAMAALL